MASAAVTSVSIHSSTVSPHSNLAGRLLTVAWMSILLGLVIELILVIIYAAFGTTGDTRPFVADAVQKVSWSVLVCMGIAMGTVAARSVRSATMSLLGLLSAPLAFTVAKAAHKAVSQTLGIDITPGASPVMLATIKGCEFACLGMVVGWLSTKAWGGLRAHLIAGFIIALVFGSAIVSYTIHSAPTTPHLAKIVTLATNELIYPVGCSVILFAAGALGTQLGEKNRGPSSAKAKPPKRKRRR